MKVSTSAPEEDPETKARRKAEERRAEAAALASDQSILERLTLRRLRRFGTPGGGTSPSLAYPGGPGGSGSGSGGGSGGGRGGGGGGGVFGGIGGISSGSLALR